LFKQPFFEKKGLLILEAIAEGFQIRANLIDFLMIFYPFDVLPF